MSDFCKKLLAVFILNLCFTTSEFAMAENQEEVMLNLSETAFRIKSTQDENNVIVNNKFNPYNPDNKDITKGEEEFIKFVNTRFEKNKIKFLLFYFGDEKNTKI